MILSALSDADLARALDEIGMRAALEKSRSVLIKLNLARPPEPGHPRTDPALLTQVIRYLSSQGAHCALAEAAGGFLPQNIEQIGLTHVVREHQVEVIDLDRADFAPVVIDDETNYLPKCLKDYAIHIGMPALFKRPDKTFSNNVKLFVGAVPRSMYQVGEPTASRPRVHVDLHRSVANIYRAVMQYAPFGFFINGGTMMIDGRGEIQAQSVLVGDNAVELDCYQLQRFNLPVPEYLARLISDSVSSPRP